MVTKRGTSLASMTSGQVNLNLFLEKEQLTQMMSTSTRMISKMRAQSMTKKVLKLTPGRQVIMLSLEKILEMLLRVSPPFQAFMMDSSKGKASIWKQSRPDQKMRPNNGYYYSSFSSLSRRTYSTLKIESLRSFHALNM